MQTGLYEYAEDARLREAEEARAEREQSVPVTTEEESKICDSQESYVLLHSADCLPVAVWPNADNFFSFVCFVPPFVVGVERFISTLKR